MYTISFEDWSLMNLAMVGSFHGTKPEIHVRVEKEGEVIFLQYPYVFINVSFCIKNSSIYSAMKTDNVCGLFMDCDFSSFSPTKTTDSQKEAHKKEYESMVKERLEKHDASLEIEEGKKLRLVYEISLLSLTFKSVKVKIIVKLRSGPGQGQVRSQIRSRRSKD